MKDIFDLIKEQDYSSLSDEELAFGKELFETEEEFNTLKFFLKQSDESNSTENVSKKVKDDLDAMFVEGDSKKNTLLRFAAVAAVLIIGLLLIPFDSIQNDFSKEAAQIADNSTLTKEKGKSEKPESIPTPIAEEFKKEESNTNKQEEVRSEHTIVSEQTILLDLSELQDEEVQIEEVALKTRDKKSVFPVNSNTNASVDVEQDAVLQMNSAPVAIQAESRRAVSDKDGVYMENQSADKFAVSLNDLDFQNDDYWIAF